ncbi:MAG TPA: TonB-dependent receptor [Chitinophagaceae bacterium]|nr:TonB-dependent receptor [Chitinophagaceae bacterium]
MRKISLLILMSLFQTVLFSQTSGTLSGKITNKETNEALPGATVTIKESSISTITNNEGYFILEKVSTGKVVLMISYVGYEINELTADITADNKTTVNAALSLDSKVGNEIVVSASKHPEKITNAPASIQVIGIKEIEQFAGSNVSELVSKVQGVEYTRSGVDEITFNARGLNSAFNIKVFQLVDGRNSMAAASGGIALFNNGSTNKDDIERIEIVLGPQTALYGPNAHNALFNYITKDPRKYPGTTIAVSAGSQSQFSSRFRHAAKINNKWAYKLSGEHATGQDYKWYDSVYAGGNAGPVINGFGPVVAIPERIHDFNFRRYRGEAHVYYSVTPKSDIILSSGGSKFTRLQVTAAGRNQLRDFTYGFLQARFVHPHFFANIYNTWSNLGTSILIGNYTRDFWNRTHSTITNPTSPLYNNFGKLSPDSAEMYAHRLGNTLKERSHRLNGEVQYNYDFQKAGLFLVTGLNYQEEKPNGFGITLIDSFQRIKITQYGAVLQLEKSLPWKMRLIGSTRFDHHSNFGSFFAPRFALVKAISDGNFRITWGRAYSMPSILNQYAGINGFLFGNGKGIFYIPNGTNVNDISLFKTTLPLKPEQVNTWEFGYKGTIAKNLFVDINYYNGLSKNFISPTITVPGRVITANGFKVTHNPAFAGVVVNDTLKNASFLTFFNYGNVRAYGVDVGLNYSFNKFISLAVKYSRFGSNITEDNNKNDANKDGYTSLEEKSLNAPKNRGVAILSFQNLCKQKMFINIAARFVEQYDFYSGSQIGTAAGKGSRGKIERPGLPPLLKNFDWGPLGNFTTVDLSAGFKINKMVGVGMGITNLFDTKQIEFVGSPSIKRLFSVEVKLNVPDLANK